MPRRRDAIGGRVDGEDVAVARRRWRWSVPYGQPWPPDGWNDPTYAPPELLERVQAEPSAADHPPCCWCHRCVVRAQAGGAWPMDRMTCARVHRHGVHA